MQVIFKERNTVLNIWGKPKPTDTVYRLMKYTIDTMCDDGILLQNCVTRELVLLNDEEKLIIDSLPCEYNEAMDELIEHRFLVPVEFDEYKSVNQLRSVMNVVSTDKSIKLFTILPTTACNARCFYCYESDMEHHTMTEQVADDVVKYIVKNSGESEIKLDWFGGEPTLGIDKIDKICTGLRDNGVNYYSSMVSNGYLLTEDVADKAKELWNLKNIQITLDGTEEIYNKTKAFVNPISNPFYQVLDNIGYLADREIIVTIRLNLDKHNYQDLEDLIKLLGERFGNSKYVCAYISVLYNGSGFDPIIRNDIERIELDKRKVELYQLLLDQGIAAIKKGLPSITTRLCMADNDSAVLINPKGGLAKCEHFPYNTFGSIYSDDYDKDAKQSWKKTDSLPACKECKLYPRCLFLANCGLEKNCTEVESAFRINNYKQNMQNAYTYKTISEENDNINC